MATWWAATLQAKLSQGDVITEAILASILHPPAQITKQTLPGNRLAWIEGDADQREHWIARGNLRAVLVLSHSCELDKNERKQRAMVAPVLAADGLPLDQRTRIFEQTRLSQMPLPGVPVLGDCYCDLRLIQHVDRRALEASTKVASLSEPDGLDRLHAQLVGFLTRRK